MNDLEIRAIRYMYQNDLRSFCPLAARLLYPGLGHQSSLPTQVLGEALERCCRRETRRLIINMPPKSSKSLYASVAMPAWLLGTRPESKIICVAGHRGLADEQHALTRTLMSHPTYQGLFTHAALTTTASRIRLPQGGSRIAMTPASAFTGRGADMIIIDDPQKPDEAEDRSKGAALRSWFDRNIYQRLDEKEDGVVILVMQRLAQDDLTAHLLSRGGWELISLPAIATQDERFPRVFGNRVVRAKGEALYPAHEDRAQLREAMLQVGARAFMAQYQQSPYPPGQGGSRGGAFHIAPRPDATEDECKGSPLFFAQIPEETFLLDSLFGEPTCIRPGPPPALSAAEWERSCGPSGPRAGQLRRTRPRTALPWRRLSISPSLTSDLSGT